MNNDNDLDLHSMTNCRAGFASDQTYPSCKYSGNIILLTLPRSGFLSKSACTNGGNAATTSYHIGFSFSTPDFNKSLTLEMQKSGLGISNAVFDVILANNGIQSQIQVIFRNPIHEYLHVIKVLGIVTG